MPVTKTCSACPPSVEMWSLLIFMTIDHVTVHVPDLAYMQCCGGGSFVSHLCCVALLLLMLSIIRHL